MLFSSLLSGSRDSPDKLTRRSRPMQEDNPASPADDTIRQRLLFALLLLLVIFAPVLESGLLASTGVALLEVAVVLGGVYASSLTSKRLAIGLLLAVPAVITSWGFLFVHTARLDLARMFSLFVIFSYCFFTILKWIFSTRRIGLEEIFGAANSYILIALSFGLIYCILERLMPGSFEIGPHGATTASFTYYSFSTIETLGYGDISPVHPLARSLSIVEAMVGVFFVAALIGHLVGTMQKAGRLPKSRVVNRRSIHVEQPPMLSIVTTVVLVILLNSIIPVLRSGFDLPFYFDTWGTMAGVMIGGLKAGIAGGVLYSLLECLLTNGQSSWVWSLESLLVAILTWFLFRRHWVDIHRPFRLVLTGILMGTCTASLALFLMRFVREQMYTFETGIFNLIVSHFKRPGVALALEQLAIDWMDKTLSICVAAVLVFAVHEFRLARTENPEV